MQERLSERTIERARLCAIGRGNWTWQLEVGHRAVQLARASGQWPQNSAHDVAPRALRPAVPDYTHTVTATAAATHSAHTAPLDAASGANTQRLSHARIRGASECKTTSGKRRPHAPTFTCARERATNRTRERARERVTPARGVSVAPHGRGRRFPLNDKTEFSLSWQAL